MIRSDSCTDYRNAFMTQKLFYLIFLFKVGRVICVEHLRDVSPFCLNLDMQDNISQWGDNNNDDVADGVAVGDLWKLIPLNWMIHCLATTLVL